VVLEARDEGANVVAMRAGDVESNRAKLSARVECARQEDG